MTNNWIIGCGNIGKRVNRVLQKRMQNVCAITRSKESASKLKKLKINAFIADLDDTNSLINLPLENENIFYFAPPSIEGNEDIRMSNFLDNLKTDSPPRRIVYISTTGVYGDCKGKWITERTPTAPNNARSKRRLNAENLLQSFCKKANTDYIILRVSGIYCEEKLPFSRIKNGLSVLRSDIAPPSNRIHSADLTNICLAAMDTIHANCILNVSDGNPSSISDYFIQTAKLFNLPLPLEIDWQQAEEVLSKEMLSYLTESKKVDAREMIKKLNIKLLYPNLNIGLRACKQKIENNI